ncbi:hypothetical protein J4E93_003700 [Alternaria ventricosa]|uniref:uncharacterized protein n=1 Tax=Alternaria ventricosa TaxID=1187951 RepID=UPI0020C3DA00|nr:uncharacterized protein J4E93_003700 [Alternaria ventricosa]KAI4649382.1 hypothetical protein J4E93_003700 [Alternaria ventricosa]
MIEADDFCMNHQSIAPLLACIWKYSPSHVSSTPTAVEMAAGHRYWLPCGCLAEEWITFFTFADGWLDLAPPGVRSAYEDDLVDNFGVWPSFARIMQDETSLSTHYDWFLPGELSDQLAPSGSHSHHMTHSQTPRVAEKTSYPKVARDPSNATALKDGYGQPNSARRNITETTGLRRGLLLGQLSGTSPRALRQSSAAPFQALIKVSTLSPNSFQTANYAHDTQTPGICSRSKISYHFKAAEEWQKEYPDFVPTASLRNVSRDSLLKGENRILHDFFLYNMGDGVAHPPARRQAQMLTRVIEHVRRVTGDRHIRLSQAAEYARRYNITVPVNEQMNFMNLAVEDQLPSPARLLAMKADYWNKFGDHP